MEPLQACLYSYKQGAGIASFFNHMLRKPFAGAKLIQKKGAKVDRDFRVSIEKRKGMLALEGGIGKNTLRLASTKRQVLRSSLLRLAYKNQRASLRMRSLLGFLLFSGGACNSRSDA